MIIYPIQSIESANGKLSSISLPSNPNGHVGSMRVKAKKEHLLSTSHQRMFPLVMVALLAAVLGITPTARAQDIPQKGDSMEAIGLLVTLEARPGRAIAPQKYILNDSQSDTVSLPFAKLFGALRWTKIGQTFKDASLFDPFAVNAFSSAAR